MCTSSMPVGTILLLLSIFLFSPPPRLASGDAGASQPGYAKYSGGSGTAEDPYRIATAEDLIALGESPEDYDKHFILTDNIDLAGHVFDKAVIAPDTDPNDMFSQFQGTSFTGVFDGNDHTISHLTITGADYLGLFGRLASGAEDKDLGVLDVNVTSWGGPVGSLVGYNSGSITNCCSTGRVSSPLDAGGLVGRNDGVVSQCYSTASVSGAYDAGGVVGQNSGTVTRCYSTGAVSGTADFIGGLVGYNERGAVTWCCSTGPVRGRDSLGGLVGQNDGDVLQCYSTGAVSGAGGHGGVGGLVGENHANVAHCYSIGAVSGGGEDVGGLVGRNWWGTVIHSLWDIETSGQAETLWSEGAGKTTAEMQTASTFLLWGTSEKEGVWTIDEGKDYPRLWWENAPGDPIAKTYCYGGGSGTQADPYVIYTAEELNVIGLIPFDWDKHFKLMADIDMSGFDGREGRPAFNIIAPGGWGKAFWGIYFTGVFDGNGHNISHLTIRGNGHVGLFGRLESGAEVKDLRMVNVNITGAYYVAGLAGYNGGGVLRCYSTGAVSGGWYVGGLVGENYGAITTSCSAGTVSGASVGGLVGENHGTVTNCYSIAAASSSSSVGGLVGYNYRGTVTRCYSTGPVTGSDESIGGLVGRNYRGNVTGCFWDIEASGQASSDGGTGLTTAQMQTASIFLIWGTCESEGVWTIDEGKDYPRLAWEHKPGQAIDIRLSDFLAGTGTEDDPYLIYAAEDVNTIARFPCEYDKHFRLMFVEGQGTPESPYLIASAEQIDLLNLCPYERDAHFKLGFVTGEGTPESPYLIATAEQIDLLNLCPYEHDAHFKLGFVTGEGTEEDPYIIQTADDLALLSRCPYEQDRHFRLGFLAGEGTQDSPYLIYTADELNLVGMCPYERDAHFKLMADIDLSSFDGKDGRPAFTIIGGAYPMWFQDGDRPFSGIFDGNDHTISNFSYTSDGTYNAGLFGYVSGPNSVIENLKLTWPNIDGGESGNVGTLVGYLESGTVANCHIDGGSVSGGWQVGGLLGTSYGGTITDCTSTATVSGNSSIGGLVGYSGWQGVVTRCSSTGTVTGGWSVGGLAGFNNWGTINHCDSGGRVLGDDGVGGLVGTSGSSEDWWWCEEPGTIYDSYSTAAVLGTGSNCGGLVGSNDTGEVARCYASGIVLGVGTVGGLAGWNGGNISSCYSTADVGGEKDVGGLVGLNSWGGLWSPEGTIANCYSAGIVLGDEYVGGLVGEGDANDVLASFWDIGTSGKEMSAGGTGKTTAEMQTARTFLEAGLPAGAGWDFVGETENGAEDIWAICEGVDYPHLAWEYVIGDFDADADTDFGDFCILAEHWLAADGSFWCGQGCDLTNDGSVNWQDLMVFVKNWISSVEP